MEERPKVVVNVRFQDKTGRSNYLADEEFEFELVGSHIHVHPLGPNGPESRPDLVKRKPSPRRKGPQSPLKTSSSHRKVSPESNCLGDDDLRYHAASRSPSPSRSQCSGAKRSRSHISRKENFDGAHQSKDPSQSSWSVVKTKEYGTSCHPRHGKMRRSPRHMTHYDEESEDESEEEESERFISKRGRDEEECGYVSKPTIGKHYCNECRQSDLKRKQVRKKTGKQMNGRGHGSPKCNDINEEMIYESLAQFPKKHEKRLFDENGTSTLLEEKSINVKQEWKPKKNILTKEEKNKNSRQEKSPETSSEAAEPISSSETNEKTVDKKILEGAIIGNASTGITCSIRCSTNEGKQELFTYFPQQKPQQYKIETNEGEENEKENSEEVHPFKQDKSSATLYSLDLKSKKSLKLRADDGKAEKNEN